MWIIFPEFADVVFQAHDGHDLMELGYVKTG